MCVRTPPHHSKQTGRWRGRTVVATLTAFGGSSSTIENPRALRARDVEVLYGTDLGNSLQVGIQVAEINAMLSAGMSMSQILVSATSAAAETWGLALDVGPVVVTDVGIHGHNGRVTS